jgi:hypothetical protein
VPRLKHGWDQSDRPYQSDHGITAFLPSLASKCSKTLKYLQEISLVPWEVDAKIVTGSDISFFGTKKKKSLEQL